MTALRNAAFRAIAFWRLSRHRRHARRGESETIDQALCRMIEAAATKHRMPEDYFARLIWQESRFDPALSPPGAQGIAQFMPATATVAAGQCFDPAQAVAKSAELLEPLRTVRQSRARGGGL